MEKQLDVNGAVLENSTKKIKKIIAEKNCLFMSSLCSYLNDSTIDIRQPISIRHFKKASGVWQIKKIIPKPKHNAGFGNIIRGMYVENS